MEEKRKGRKSGRIPSREELALWLSATVDVKAVKDLPDLSQTGAGSQKPFQDRIIVPVKTRVYPGKITGGSDRGTFEKLKKGKFPIDRRLDLHGMTQDQAFENLSRVLMGCHEAQERVVLVITGKGNKTFYGSHWTDPEAGVLRRMFPEWLRTPPLDRIVLEYTEARHRDGGKGAFYVLLRRKRD